MNIIYHYLIDMLKRNILTIKNEEKIWLNKIIFNNVYGNAFCRYFQGVIKNTFNLLKRYICIIKK